MGNKSGKLTPVLNRIYGQVDIPLIERPPVLGAYFDSGKNGAASVIVVTSSRIEILSSRTGVRLCYTKPPRFVQIYCCAFFPRSSIGTCVVAGCSDCKVRVYLSKNLKFKGVLPHEKSSENNGDELISSNPIKNLARMTTIACPLNNALVCGFSDGSVLALYLETREIAGIFRYPADLIGNSAQPVSFLGFCLTKSYVIVGYAQQFENMVQSRKVPIVIYSLQRSEYVQHYIGAKHTILNAQLLEDRKYLIACSTKQILIWKGDSGELFFTYDFASQLPGLYSHNVCLSSVIVPIHGVIFSSFDSGSVLCTDLFLPKDTKCWGTASNEINIRGENERRVDSLSVVSRPRRLLQIHSEDTIGLQLLDACVHFLWYEPSKQMLISGDNLSRVKLLPNFFNFPLPNVA